MVTLGLDAAGFQDKEEGSAALGMVGGMKRGRRSALERLLQSFGAQNFPGLR